MRYINMKTWAGYVTAGKEGRVWSGELRVNGARRTLYQLEDLRGPLKPARDHWMEEVLTQYVTLFYSEKSALLLFGITHSFLLVLVSAGIVINLNNYQGDHNHYYFYCFLHMIYKNYVWSMRSFFFFFLQQQFSKKGRSLLCEYLIVVIFLS